MSLEQNEILAELAAFDDAFNPRSGQLPGLDALPDGLYQFQIMHVDLARTQKNNQTILRWGLKVLDGAMTGTVVEKVNFFTSQQNVDILGSELCSLGIDADMWKPPTRTFSKELPKALPRLGGIRFVATKEAKKDGEKTYHNLRIKTLLPKMTSTAPAAQQSASTPTSASVDEEVPF